MKKKNSGITLISLIITIIIMLILAVVTLNLVGDGGILDKTENAVKATISAEAEEDTQMLISGLIMKYHQEVDVDADGNPLQTGQEYIEEKLADGQKTSSGKYFVKAEDGAVITFEGDSAEDATQDNKVANGFLAENGAVEWHEVVEIPSELDVGDYVTYAPSGTYNWEAQYASSDLATDGSADVLLSSAEGEKFNITSWRVFSINQVTGKVELVPAASKTGYVRLQGAQGYNNGVKLLNDACSSLYGDSEKGISARSINIEDIESRMTPEALAEAHSYQSAGAKYGEQVEDKYISNRKYPIIYGKENLSVINEVKNTGLNLSEQNYLIKRDDDGATDGILIANISMQPYQTDWVKDNSFMQRAFQNESGENIVYNVIMPHGMSTEYWLASRYVVANVGNALFGVTSNYNGIIYSSYLFNTLGSVGEFSYPLFPIVSLNVDLLTWNDTDGWNIN